MAEVPHKVTTNMQQVQVDVVHENIEIVFGNLTREITQIIKN